MAAKLYWLFLFASTILEVTSSMNILLIPFTTVSHVRYFSQVSGGLVAKGHNVYSLMNSKCNRAISTLEKANIQVLTYRHLHDVCPTEGDQSDEQIKGLVSQVLGPPNPFKSMSALAQLSSMAAVEGDSIFSDEALILKLREMRIDLAIVDGWPLTIYQYVLPHQLDIPYASLTSVLHAVWAGVPDLPSLTPLFLTPFSNRMSISERTLNTLAGLILNLNVVFPGSSDVFVDKYAPEKQKVDPVDMALLRRRCKLWLINTDLNMDYPRALLPHVIPIGGLSTGPAKPLPTDLAKIAGSANKGLVIVSFGSMISDLPQQLLDTLYKGLTMLDDITIIWKYNGPPLANLPGHVHIAQWLPQNDLLGHPNTKLFVTHCGNNGQFEALYHAVPMVGVPVLADQPYNAERMKNNGFGELIALHDLTAERLEHTVRKVLYNASYAEAIGKASSRYRQQLMGPRERAVHWIEHVVEHGSKHLIPPGILLPWYQYWGLDVWAILAFIIILLFSLLGLGMRCMCGMLRGKKSKVKKN